MHEDIENWVKLAKYDLGAAEDMLKSERYLYVLFGCQQAIEKMLKALVIQETNQFPLKTHDLIKLLELVGLSVKDDTKEFLSKLSYYYIETRYPAIMDDIIEEVEKNLAEEYFIKTKEVFEWLEQKLQ